MKAQLFISDDQNDNPRATASDFEAFRRIGNALKAIQFQPMPLHTTKEHWEAYRKQLGQMYVIMRQHLYPPEPIKKPSLNARLLAAVAQVV